MTVDVAVRKAFKEFHRVETSVKTKKALFKKKLKGERYSGSIPYGFNDVGGKLVPSTYDKRLIALVKSMSEQGWSLRQIGRKLEEHGVKTKKGKMTWSPQVISDLRKL